MAVKDGYSDASSYQKNWSDNESQNAFAQYAIDGARDEDEQHKQRQEREWEYSLQQSKLIFLREFEEAANEHELRVA